ncbi:MAG: hypothetical protein KC619_00065 [Myxococcales bacterium]|nr:hypothetical protein [Myxococcales bacterium]
MTGPRYKPRAAFDTRRPSDEEMEAVPDFAATTLDRPAANEDDLRHAQLKQHVARDRRDREDRARAQRRLIFAIGLVVGLALFAGSIAGAYLAFR